MSAPQPVSIQSPFWRQRTWIFLLALPALLGCGLVGVLPSPAASPVAETPVAVVETPLPRPTPSPVDTLPAPTAIQAVEPANATNLNRLQEAARTTLGGSVRDMAFSPDGRWLALTVQLDPAAPAVLRLFDTQTLTPVKPPQSIPGSEIAFSPDGRRLALTFYQDLKDFLTVWSTEQLIRPDGAPLVTFTDSFGGIQDLAFSPDGQLIALAPSTAQGSFVVLVEAETGQVQQKLRTVYQGTHPPLVQSVAFSPDGRWVAAGLYGGSVQLWPVAGGEAVMVAQPSSTQGSPVLFLDSNRLVAWQNGLQTTIWDRNGRPLVTLAGPAVPQTFDASPDRMLIAGAVKDRVHFWRADTGELVRAVQAESVVQQLRFGPQGRLAVVDESGTLHLWAVAQGVPLPDAPPLPTPTPSPMPTPIPPPTPTVPPQTDTLSEQFAAARQKLTQPDERLGQPLGPPVPAEIIIHRFRHGMMVEGVQDVNGRPVILVAIYGDGWDILRGTEWYMLDTDWQAGQPEYPCPETAPPDGPRQGMGQVWCQYAELRQRLGEPFSNSRQVSQAGYQHYQTGLMVWIPGQGILALSGQGMWEMVSD